MAFTFRCWTDFGRAGTQPDDVDLQYAGTPSSERPDEVDDLVDTVWNEVSEGVDGLHDAPGFTVSSASGTTVDLGPARFKEYYVRRLLLAGDERVETACWSDEARDHLIKSVHLCSSFVAVLAAGHVFLGVKPGGADRDPVLSFPGSGYLDRRFDEREGEVVPTATLVGRELSEEVGIDVASCDLTCFGVFEDTDPDSHLNPALMTAVETGRSPEAVRERAMRAPDAGEFERFETVPLTRDGLESVLALASPASDAAEGPSEHGLGDCGSLSHKSLLMVLLLGRWQFGDDWWTGAVDDGGCEISVHDPASL